jgi:hypothetical protein
MDLSSFALPRTARAQFGTDLSQQAAPLAALAPGESTPDATMEVSSPLAGDSCPSAPCLLSSEAGDSEPPSSAQSVPLPGLSPPESIQPALEDGGDPPIPNEEELFLGDDLEIDPQTHPLQSTGPSSVAEWEIAVRKIVPRQPIFEDPVEQVTRVRTLLARIQNVNLRSDPASRAEAESLLASLPDVLRNPEQFVAGSFTSCHAAWSALLENSNRKSLKTVLGWLKSGVKPQFVGTAEAKAKNRDLVVGMLKRQMPAEEIPGMLAGKRPHPVKFDNHKSFYNNSEFALGEASKLVLWSAASIVKEGEEMPLVVHPLGVAFTGGKGRMIVNSRYCNLFMKLLQFQYERLRDVLAFTKEGFFMANWDLKSGYYHVLLHPDFRKYFGIQIGQTVLRLNVVFFGYAHACYVFTKIMQEPCFALRAAGIPVSNYVDDGFTAAETRLTCLWQAVLAVLLQASLGGFHGLAKCQIEPVQLIKWLGFMLDLVRERFEVGAQKLDKLKDFLRSILSKKAVSARDLAQVAGKIISLSPAVAPAALYTRSFFQAITGHTSWDALFPNPAEVREALTFWLDNLDRFNGRPWWPEPISLRVEVDASGVGFGGVLSAPSSPPLSFQGTFSPDQAAGSSTLREVLGYVGAVGVAAESFPSLLLGASILVTGNNQGAVSCINNFRSPVPAINEALRDLFRIRSELHCDVLARWVPRENLAAADALSREPDASDWGIQAGLYANICKRFGVQPAVDIFASDIHHQAPEFCSRIFVPGCKAIDAFRQDWAELLQSRTAWVFPPNRAVSQSLSLIEQHKVDALLVMPLSVASNEAIQLSQLKAVVQGPFTIPRAADSCTASMRVPATTLNPAFLGLRVFHIVWT